MPPIDVPAIPSPALDAAKAGVKTAVVAFLLQGFLAVTGLINEALEYFQKGDPIDIGVSKSIMFAAVSALAVGLLNTAMRFAQAIQLPVVAWVVTKLLGAIPAYPEAGVTKIVMSPDSAIETSNPAQPIIAPATPRGEPGANVPPQVLEVVNETIAQYGYADVAAAFAAAPQPTN